jgi:glycosyltransferase involved in cell wall biosynthesis
LAAEAGARVVEGAPLPDGWVGKPWALQQGLEAATGEWVVTLDADTAPHPGLLGALVRRAEADGWDYLSVGGRIECLVPIRLLCGLISCGITGVADGLQKLTCRNPSAHTRVRIVYECDLHACPPTANRRPNRCKITLDHRNRTVHLC